MNLKEKQKKVTFKLVIIVVPSRDLVVYIR